MVPYPILIWILVTLFIFFSVGVGYLIKTLNKKEVFVSLIILELIPYYAFNLSIFKSFDNILVERSRDAEALSLFP